MSITMIPQPTGMALPRCGVCGKDIFCKDVLSQQEISNYPYGSLHLEPRNLAYDLVGHGLSSDNLTCSHCLQQGQMERP